MSRWINEWNIVYSVHDGYGDLTEYVIVLPTFTKVLWWFIRKGRKACEVYIWVSGQRKSKNQGVLYDHERID